MNNDLELIKLIHDISQLHYEVKFAPDFNNMVRLEFFNEFDDNFYEHYHLGIPDGGLERLETEINRELKNFLEERKKSDL